MWASPDCQATFLARNGAEMPLKPHKLLVTSLSGNARRGWLRHGQRWYAVALGRSGRRPRKREGDGATPVGTWHVIAVLYRPDRTARPRTGIFPVRRIAQRDGWCDAEGDRNYNRPVRLPYPASAERMWREDGLYDIVVVLDHNQRPRVQGGGSAIFMHVARAGYAPTEGCIALARGDLMMLVARLRKGAAVVVR